ncbi:MAG TPA: hypothetical protein VFQ35_25045 [Polyangiaceae bacterium]|nr:hypothetical protein [Polyangiaceae bacterium]
MLPNAASATTLHDTTTSEPLDAARTSSAVGGPSGGTDAALEPSSTSDSPKSLLDSVALEQRLREHYAKYIDGTRFDFFAVDFAPRVERYLALHDVEVSKLQAEARRFFRDKKHLSFAPKAGSLLVNRETPRTRVQFVLTMAWSQNVSSAFKDCAASDPTLGGDSGPSTIAHKVDVHAELVLDESGRFVSYREIAVVAPRLKVETRSEGVPAFIALPNKPGRSEEPTAPLVPDGTIVEDMGDAFTCSLYGETDTVRKVRVNGKVIWLLAEWTWFTGHNYVGELLLRPVPLP